MKQQEHEGNYSLTTIAMEYGNFNLQFSSNYSYSLQKLTVWFLY